MRGLSGVVLLACALACGCQTASQDFAEFADALSPITSSQAARWALDQTDADQRRKGVIVIANSDIGGYDVYVNLYREYAQHEVDAVARAAAIRALARHGTAEDAPIVAANLAHPVSQVRWEAARGLQRLHNPEVVQSMLAVLRDQSQPPEIRAALATALGQYPQDRVVQGLIGGLDAWELSVNRAAAASLACLSGQDLGLDSRAWLDWYAAAAAAGDPFAGRREYVYPTYSRKETFLESLAFWSSNKFEQPGPPAGLRPASERRTYDEQEAGGTGAGTDGGTGGG